MARASLLVKAMSFSKPSTKKLFSDTGGDAMSSNSCRNLSLLFPETAAVPIPTEIIMNPSSFRSVATFFVRDRESEAPSVTTTMTCGTFSLPSARAQAAAAFRALSVLVPFPICRTSSTACCASATENFSSKQCSRMTALA